MRTNLQPVTALLLPCVLTATDFNVFRTILVVTAIERVKVQTMISTLRKDKRDEEFETLKEGTEKHPTSPVLRFLIAHVALARCFK